MKYQLLSRTHSALALLHWPLPCLWQYYWTLFKMLLFRWDSGAFEYTYVIPALPLLFLVILCSVLYCFKYDSIAGSDAGLLKYEYLPTGMWCVK